MNWMIKEKKEEKKMSNVWDHWLSHLECYDAVKPLFVKHMLGVALATQAYPCFHIKSNKYV